MNKPCRKKSEIVQMKPGAKRERWVGTDQWALLISFKRVTKKQPDCMHSDSGTVILDWSVSPTSYILFAVERIVSCCINSCACHTLFIYRTSHFHYTTHKPSYLVHHTPQVMRYWTIGPYFRKLTDRMQFVMHIVSNISLVYMELWHLKGGYMFESMGYDSTLKTKKRRKGKGKRKGGRYHKKYAVQTMICVAKQDWSRVRCNQSLSVSSVVWERFATLF